MKKTFKTLVCLTTCIIMAGCGKETEHASPSPMAPEVTAAKPQRRNILRTVGQPGFVDAYEQSSIFPKITGFIEKWNVDIGDKVKKDQLLATLFVPELVEEHRLKQATVVLDKVMVEQAKKACGSCGWQSEGRRCQSGPKQSSGGQVPGRGGSMAVRS